MELSPLATEILGISDRLAAACDALCFAPPVVAIYNPLVYARAAWQEYLGRFARRGGVKFFLGMNPGPFGMAQTGIPFGAIPAVRDWMGITVPIGQPPQSHPQRPVQGFACPKVEVSGQRLWGLFAQYYPVAADFFERAIVFNYCPLAFMNQSGANLTPDKLPKPERTALFAHCDAALAEILALLRPTALIGIGAFAQDCLSRCAGPARLTNTQIAKMPHPSPANPGANRDWAGSALKALDEAGLWPL